MYYNKSRQTLTIILVYDQTVMLHIYNIRMCSNVPSTCIINYKNFVIECVLHCCHHQRLAIKATMNIQYITCLCIVEDRIYTAPLEQSHISFHILLCLPEVFVVPLLTVSLNQLLYLVSLWQLKNILVTKNMTLMCTNVTKVCNDIKPFVYG